MELFYQLVKALTVGILFGFLFGSYKMLHKPVLSKEQQAKSMKILKILSATLKYITACFLCIGFIWCFFFLVLAACMPEYGEYANNMSQLIVSVLTIISIIFAFVEFSNRSR